MKLVLKNLKERIKKVRASFERAKAKAHGMTVPELRRHLAKRKAEKRAFKAELRRKEQEERRKFEKWKIKQKYKEKRKRAKKRKGKRFDLESLFGGSQSSDSDPLGIFGPPKKPRAKRKKRRR